MRLCFVPYAVLTVTLRMCAGAELPLQAKIQTFPCSAVGGKSGFILALPLLAKSLLEVFRAFVAQQNHEAGEMFQPKMTRIVVRLSNQKTTNILLFFQSILV